MTVGVLLGIDEGIFGYEQVYSLPTSNGTRICADQKSKKRNDADDIFIALFLTHVGNLITVKGNQRRFAPTPARIEWIRLPTSPEYAT